ncbi:MAG: SDR family oxidoreductase [Leptospiraceae bacterium]|nr:SDR family oxidoreductase [Leptospiraceae bacterium]
MQSEQTYLLLGGTGFLGNFFLRECLKKSKKIYLIIRKAYQKQQVLERIKLFNLSERINLLKFFLGDASLPKFGLKEAEWEEVSKVSKIFNLAGSTNFLATRKELALKNVEILRNCLELASLGNLKEIHHISTLAILLLNDMELSEVSEDSEILETTQIYGGYAQSKWQAEFLLQNSSLPHSIYRLGLLVGDSEKGIPNWKDTFCFFLKSANMWKNLEISQNLALDFLPVDLAAREIFQWSEKHNRPSLLHIFGDTLYFREIQELIRDSHLSFAPNFFEVSYTKFLLELIKQPYHRIHPLGLFLKTDRTFRSNYYTPPKFQKELILEKILKDLAI